MAAIPRRAAACSAATAAAKSVALCARPSSRSQRVSGRRAASRSGGTGTVAADTDHRTRKCGSSSGPYGGGTSTTSWPSSSSRAEASS